MNQSLWRQEQGLGAKEVNGRSFGSCLDREAAAAGRNLMSVPARRAALDPPLSDGQVIDTDRLLENLLASQAICFSIFAHLREDLSTASRVIGNLLGKLVEVTRIELEYSPGRGAPEFTQDGSAADAYVEYTAGHRRGFICVETKYFEDLQKRRGARDTFRPRYAELAKQMGVFRNGALEDLRVAPLEQLWRDHLLAGAILLHPDSEFDEGAFALVYPEMNEACKAAAREYRTRLADERTFSTWTLEEVCETLIRHADYDWAWELRDRYLDYYRVDREIQEHHLGAVARWATTVREDLGELQRTEGHRVWFRPSSSGFAMVGLLPEKPQLGTSYTTTGRLRANFSSEFAAHCDGDGPERSTPEKRLQSFLVSAALTSERRMSLFEDELTFVTDELVLPGVRGDQRLDILALREGPSGTRLALIELKSTRAMTELQKQTQVYSEILDAHRGPLQGLVSAILGREVTITAAPEKWIVWPSTGAGADPRIPEFGSIGVRVVGYSETDDGFEFMVGPVPRGA